MANRQRVRENFFRRTLSSPKAETLLERIAKGLFVSDFVEEQFLEMERLENEVYIAQRLIERETARDTGAHVSSNPPLLLSNLILVRICRSKR